MQYTVTRVRRESSADGSHRHLAGVCTTEPLYYIRKQVVDSINAGNTWRTYSGGSSARIKPMDFCPNAGCLATPYITTAPDHTTTNNLESLP